MKLSKRLDGIGEYYFSAKLREIEQLNQEGKSIVSLGIGSPDLPPHPDVIRTLSEESAKPHQHGYQSYKGSMVLRAAIADWYRSWYGVELDPASEVLPLIGSKEGIMHICMTYLQKGDRALVPDPGYPTYQSAVKLAGAKPVTYTLDEHHDYAPQLERISRKLKNVKLMFVNYPHMPSGRQATDELFRDLVAFARKQGILLVHDNPYSFILNSEPKSLLKVEGAKDCVLELNSLSKSHNMAGWRVGMLCGSAARINEVLRFKSNMDSGMFLPLQLAAARALQLGADWHQELNSVYRGRRKKVEELLGLLGCTYNADQVGLFMWARVPEHVTDGYTLSDEILYRAQVFLTPGGIFGKAGKKYIRVSLCAPEEKVQEAIDRISTRLIQPSMQQANGAV